MGWLRGGYALGEAYQDIGLRCSEGDLPRFIPSYFTHLHGPGLHEREQVVLHA